MPPGQPEGAPDRLQPCGRGYSSACPAASEDPFYWQRALLWQSPQSPQLCPSQVSCRQAHWRRRNRAFHCGQYLSVSHCCYHQPCPPVTCLVLQVDVWVAARGLHCKAAIHPTSPQGPHSDMHDHALYRLRCAWQQGRASQCCTRPAAWLTCQQMQLRTGTWTTPAVLQVGAGLMPFEIQSQQALAA